MVRSAEAIERRAAKRNRSVAAQKEADALAAFGARATKAARTSSSSNDMLKIGTVIKFTWNETDATGEGEITKISDKSSSIDDEEDAGSAGGIKKLRIALTVPQEFPDGTVKKEIKVSTDSIRYEIVKKKITSVATAKPTSISSPVPKSVTPPAAAAEPASDWVCGKCNNKNFGSRPSCNRCGVDRGDVTPSAVLSVVADASAKLKSAIVKRPQTEAPKSSSWKHQEPASAAQLDENQRLRDAYATDKSSLTADELKRAELLVKRTERRQTRKAQKLNKKKVPYKRIATQKNQQKGTDETKKEKRLVVASAAATGSGGDSKA